MAILNRLGQPFGSGFGFQTQTTSGSDTLGGLTLDTSTAKVWTNWSDSTTNATDFGQLSGPALGGGQWIGWVQDGVQTPLTWERWIQMMPSVHMAGHRDIQAAREVIDRRQEEMNLMEREREVRAERDALVTKKASKILVDNLTEEQARSWRDRKVIPITAKSGKHYEIVDSSVYELDRHGKRVMHYCIQPQLPIPREDAILARLMWLRWCEEDFKKIAIPSRIAA